MTATLVGASSTAMRSQPSGPGQESDLLDILKRRVEQYQQSVGIVVGTIGPQGRRVVAYGSLDRTNAKPLDGDSIFEIGSVTKVFTSLLLADMAQRGEVALDDPAANYLATGLTLPERRGRRITLLDLATHTSGLPADPPNLNPADPANPLADYTVAQLGSFLSRYTLQRDIGARYEYSNVGAAVLGLALAHRAGTDYESLVRQRLLQPLALRSTAVSIAEEMTGRFAVGHSYMLEPVPHWDMPVFVASGSLRSTANDLLTLLGAAMGYTTTPLAPAFTETQAHRRPTRDRSREVALGWEVLKLGKTSEILFKDGATGGFRSFVAFDPAVRTGVVVLANAAAPAGISDIAFHAINPAIPLAGVRELTPPRHRSAIAIDPTIIARYVGTYRFGPNDMLAVTREGDRLFEQHTGELKVEIRPETERDWFCPIFDEQVSFQPDARGTTTTVIYTQNGRGRRGQRVRGRSASRLVRPSIWS